MARQDPELLACTAICRRFIKQRTDYRNHHKAKIYTHYNDDGYAATMNIELSWVDYKTIDKLYDLLWKLDLLFEVEYLSEYEIGIRYEKRP